MEQKSTPRLGFSIIPCRRWLQMIPAQDGTAHSPAGFPGLSLGFEGNWCSALVLQCVHPHTEIIPPHRCHRGTTASCLWISRDDVETLKRELMDGGERGGRGVLIKKLHVCWNCKRWREAA